MSAEILNDTTCDSQKLLGETDTLMAPDSSDNDDDGLLDDLQGGVNPEGTPDEPRKRLRRRTQQEPSDNDDVVIDADDDDDDDDDVVIDSDDEYPSFDGDNGVPVAGLCPRMPDMFGDSSENENSRSAEERQGPLESMSAALASALPRVGSMLSHQAFPRYWPLAEPPMAFTFTNEDFQGRMITTWGGLDWSSPEAQAKRLLFSIVSEALAIPGREQRRYLELRRRAVTMHLSRNQSKLSTLSDPDKIAECVGNIAVLQDGGWFEAIDANEKINPNGFSPNQPFGKFMCAEGACSGEYIRNLSTAVEHTVSDEGDRVVTVRHWVFTHNPRFKLGNMITRIIERNFWEDSKMRERVNDRGYNTARERLITSDQCFKLITSPHHWCKLVLEPLFKGADVGLRSSFRAIAEQRLGDDNPANPKVWFSARDSVNHEKALNDAYLLQGGDPRKQLNAEQATPTSYDKGGGRWEWPRPELVVSLEPSQLGSKTMSTQNVVQFNPLLDGLLSDKMVRDALTAEQRALMGMDYDNDPVAKGHLVEFAQSILNRYVDSEGNPPPQIDEDWSYDEISEAVRKALGKAGQQTVDFPDLGEVNLGAASSVLRDVPLQYLHIFASRNRLLQYNLKCAPKRMALATAAKEARHRYEKYRTQLTKAALADENFMKGADILKKVVADLERHELGSRSADSLRKEEDLRQQEEALETALQHLLEAMKTEIDSGVAVPEGESMRTRDMDLCSNVLRLITEVTKRSSAYVDLQRACVAKLQFQETLAARIWEDIRNCPKDAPEGSGLEATAKCPWSAPTVRGSRWYHSLSPINQMITVPRLTHNLDPYGEMRVAKNIAFAKYLRLMHGTPAYDIWKLQLIRQTAAHAYFGLKPNMLFVGQAAVGKSFRAQKAEETSFAGSVHRPSHTTANASNVDGDPVRDCLTIIEETEPHMLGMDNYGNVLPGGSESIKHSLASGYTVTYSCHVDEEGRRLPTVSVSCTSGTHVCLTNMKNPPLSNPVINRFVVEHVVNEVRDRRYSIRDIAGEKESEMNRVERDQFILTEHLHHWYSYVCEKMIEGGVLEDVRLDEAMDIVRLIITELETEHNIPKVQVRYYKMFVELIRAATVMGAVWSELFTEQGFEKHVWDSGADCMREFDPGVFVRDISPRLYAGVEQVVDVLSLYAPSFMPSRTFEVLNNCGDLRQSNKTEYTYRKVVNSEGTSVSGVDVDKRYIAFPVNKFEQFYHKIAYQSKYRFSAETVQSEIEALQKERCNHTVTDPHVSGIAIPTHIEEIDCIILEHHPVTRKPQVCIAAEMLRKSRAELSKVSGALKSAMCNVLSHMHARTKDAVINTPFVYKMRGPVDKDPEVFHNVMDTISLECGPRELYIRNPLATSVVDKEATAVYSTYAKWKTRLAIQSQDAPTESEKTLAGPALASLTGDSGDISTLAQEAAVLYVSMDFDTKSCMMRLIDIQYPGDVGEEQLRFDAQQDRERCLEFRDTTESPLFRNREAIPNYPLCAALSQLGMRDLEDDLKEPKLLEQGLVVSQELLTSERPEATPFSRYMHLQKHIHSSGAKEAITKNAETIEEREKLLDVLQHKRKHDDALSSMEVSQADNYAVCTQVVAGTRVDAGIKGQTKRAVSRDISYLTSFMLRKDPNFGKSYNKDPSLRSTLRKSLVFDSRAHVTRRREEAMQEEGASEYDSDIETDD